MKYGQRMVADESWPRWPMNPEEGIFSEGSWPGDDGQGSSPMALCVLLYTMLCNIFVDLHF